MSEFKYACPVCGQHIRCDSTQSGSVMDCPTCFQKIIVPQAPANADSPLILTGQKFVEKKPVKAPVLVSPVVEKTFPVAAVALAIALLVAVAAGAVAFLMFGKGSQSVPVTGSGPGGANVAAGQSAAGTKNPAPAPKKEKPALVAPPASDTNWLQNLAGVTIPDGPVAGRIHGADFIADRAYFQNGTLTLREGTRGQFDFGLSIVFQGLQAEALSGQTINVATNVAKAVKVAMRWKGEGEAGRESYESGYALRLEFGTLAKNRLPGKIYVCLPDEGKSYLMGTFSADARKPKPKAPKN